MFLSCFLGSFHTHRFIERLVSVNCTDIASIQVALTRLASAGDAVFNRPPQCTPELELLQNHHRYLGFLCLSDAFAKKFQDQDDIDWCKFSSLVQADGSHMVSMNKNAEILVGLTNSEFGTILEANTQQNAALAKQICKDQELKLVPPFYSLFETKDLLQIICTAVKLFIVKDCNSFSISSIASSPAPNSPQSFMMSSKFEFGGNDFPFFLNSPRGSSVGSQSVFNHDSSSCTLGSSECMENTVGVRTRNGLVACRMKLHIELNQTGISNFTIALRPNQCD